ncbi:hypothetical protein CGRA01v4_09423 [Colletotrichum graminicola]|nr:hypothetical protein CGRA01v4_09423 [Colletotrichum graminicola]
MSSSTRCAVIRSRFSDGSVRRARSAGAYHGTVRVAPNELSHVQRHTLSPSLFALDVVADLTIGGPLRLLQSGGTTSSGSATSSRGQGPKKDGGEMHADMAMFMAAGTEATAMVLSRMTSHLLRTPRALALLTKGILARFARSQDVSVDGLAGLATLVSLNPYLAFTHPNNWARPTEFILERWLHPEDPEWKDDKRDYVRALLVRAENLHLKGFTWEKGAPVDSEADACEASMSDGGSLEFYA